MKREFLQELTVDGQPLPKAVIDAIMAENGRDIQAAKASVDVQALRQEAEQWREKFTQAQEAHTRQLDAVAFEATVHRAVTAAQGRNIKAITALLDMEALRAAENREAALQQALDALKREEGYLFGDSTPPPYAEGTGKYNHYQQQAPATLAGALREKFERK